MRPASVIGKSILKPRPAALPGNAGAGVNLGSPRRSSTARLLETHFTHRTDVEYRNFTLRERTAWARTIARLQDGSTAIKKCKSRRK